MFSGKRQTEQTRASCMYIAHALKEGKTVFVATIGENEEYLQKCQRIIADEYALRIAYEPVTTLEPNSCYRVLYDRFDEVIGIGEVQQILKTIGYKVTLKQ